ncbi:insulinase family protein [Dactylosporangium sp. NPDC049742]|uniref:insulinase family protein n=1 Tax=Dactylosporangium sp. NPDC049742 TaxID=3154737 RepID=UPI00341F8698
MRQIDVDGVPTLYAPYEGPSVAGLVFRVGQADETLPRRGITHLLEHLVLHGRALADYHYNGTTGTVVTSFHLQGGEDDITGFLAGVCEALLDPPMDRLEAERSILRAEAAGRNDGVNDALPVWRYGARDHGLVGFPELGVDRLTPEDLREWAATWFTRQNAVLWIAGRRVPPDLRLPLRDGTRRPVAAPSSALPVTPAFYRGDGHVVVDGVMRRRIAGNVLGWVLERELYRSLRQEDGNSYAVGAAYNPRGDGHAVVTAFADAAPGKETAVLGGFVDVLAKLRVGRIDEADVAAVIAKAEDANAHPGAEVGRLSAQAFDLLTGHPVRAVEEARAELRAVTAADVHEAAVEVLGSALLQVPDGSTADWAGFTAAPVLSETAATGQPFEPRGGGKAVLVIGPDSAGLQAGDHKRTVRFAECAAMLAFPDGGRVLIGNDAIQVPIEPTLHQISAEALQSVDRALAAVTVPMPARDHVPQPRPAETGPDAADAPPAPPSRTARIVAAIGMFALAFLVLCAGGLYMVVLTGTDGDNDWQRVVARSVVCGGTVTLALIGIGLLRKPKA